MTSPVLSVIIPAYNVEKTIAATVKSLLSHHSNSPLEILIIDDGSTDQTNKICKPFVKVSGQNIVRLIHQPNGGHGAVINRGAHIAKGKYCKIIDGDDLVDPDGFTKLLDHLSNAISDVVISDYYKNYLGSNKQSRIRWHSHSIPDGSPLVDYLSTSQGILLPFITVKTDLLKSLHLTEKCYYDDQEFNLFTVIHVKTIDYLRVPVYIYNIGNATQSTSEDGYLRHLQDHAKICISLLDAYNKYRDTLDSTIRNYIETKILIPLCYLQYHIAVYSKKSRQDFLEFDRKMSRYGHKLYHHRGVAGYRIELHRLTRGLLIR